MTRYLQGDKVEVLNTKGTLEDSWHPALIVDGDEDACIVLYDAQANGVLEEWVLAKYIRPRPPVVEFSNWGRGDLVHDLNVGAGWIRVRHYWQGDQWIVVGKGPSNSDTKRRHNMISDSQKRNTGIRGNTCQKSHNVPSRAIKRNAHSIVNQTEDGSAKISRRVERSSTNACNATGIRLRFTERKGPATNEVTLKETQHHEDSSLSSTGSCSSFNTNNSSRQYSTTKNAEHHYGNDVSDAESCTWPTSHKPTKPNRYSQGNEKRDRSSERDRVVGDFAASDMASDTSSNQENAMVQRPKKAAPFKFLVPLIYAPALPLIRLSLRRNPVLRDRLFTAVLIGAFAHGAYLVYPSFSHCFSFSFSNVLL
ncbi:unnamed protein product [Rhodiola kirilowii]